MSGESGQNVTGAKDCDSKVRFTQADLELFSRASGDRNPLHLSEPYASRTAYGEPVVFGALGCLATLAHIGRDDVSISRLTADFHRPMFRNVDYRMEALTTREGTTVRLLDGSTPLLTTTVQFAPGRDRKVVAGLDQPGSFPLAEARNLGWHELAVGVETNGLYQCDPAALRMLCERWILKIELPVLEMLLWSSYYIGMEIPGRNALFFRLAFDFRGEAREQEPIRFRTKITSLNRSLGQVKTTVDLTASGEALASGQLTAFLRSEVETIGTENDNNLGSETLIGRTAIVLGASRGFGAALVRTLALEGARVIAVSRSEPGWAAGRSAWMERVTLRTADAGKAEDMANLAQEIAREYSRVDFLVCCAFPAIPSLRLEPEGAERIAGYIEKATNLVLWPLCHFLPTLQRSAGCAVVISSIAVEKPVRDWPHYVAAKQATEGLCKVAPLQYPNVSSLIVRPERLLTEMTNTPMGKHGAIDPSILARELCEYLADPPAPGTCKVYTQSAKAQGGAVLASQLASGGTKLATNEMQSL